MLSCPVSEVYINMFCFYFFKFQPVWTVCSPVQESQDPSPRSEGFLPRWLRRAKTAARAESERALEPHIRGESGETVSWRRLIITRRIKSLWLFQRVHLHDADILLLYQQHRVVLKLQWDSSGTVYHLIKLVCVTLQHQHETNTVCSLFLQRKPGEGHMASKWADSGASVSCCEWNKLSVLTLCNQPVFVIKCLLKY